MNDTQIALTAFYRWQQLQTIYLAFEEVLLKGQTGDIQITFEKKGESITATIFDHSVHLRRRPVAQDGELSNIELTFFTLSRDTETPLLRLYLDQSGNVTSDGVKRICDYNNSYMPSNIAKQIIRAMVEGPFCKAISTSPEDE